MLQGFRDNMKGTMVAVVVVLFIVPMVLSGIGGSFLGSVAGTDAASVDGESISKTELRREVYMQKQRMLNQPGVDPSSDMLKDENLTGPVLQQLAKRTALLIAAKNAGMAVSDESVVKEIKKTKDFFTDGKFDVEKYKRLLANVNYTPATYRTAISRELLLSQNGSGLRASSFVTDLEVRQFVGLLHQKRSFFAVEIPKGDAESSVTVTDEQVQKYYDEHQTAFNEQEKVSVSYLELSVVQLMDAIVIDEGAIKEQFDVELANFDTTPQFEIAHLFVDSSLDSAESKLADVEAKMAEGAAFDALVKEYSDDAGSKDSGGVLGVLTDGFPAEFAAAVQGLEVDEVSAPVKTSSGTHFIKVLKKTIPTAPVLADRKDAIVKQLKRAEAEEQYIAKLETLSDLTYSAPNLQDAARELGVKVLESAPFSRSRGEGIAAQKKVREMAFDMDVLEEGNNSSLIEISNERAVVIRKLSYVPEHIKPLELVKSDIESALVESAVDELLAQKADAFIAAATASDNVMKLAESMGYSYVQHDGASRTDPIVGRVVNNRVFAMPAPAEGSVGFASVVKPDGNYVVVGLSSVAVGTEADLEEEEASVIPPQLVSQQSMAEIDAYQNEIVTSANIKIH